MAWSTGAVLNAAGAMKAVLDAALDTATWHTEDAGAGDNVGVYHNYDASTGSDFIVVARDNQTNYCTIELYEEWDAGSHTGSGCSLINDGTYTYRMRKTAANYGLAVGDHRFIWVQYTAYYSYYIGQLKRLVNYNMPIFWGHTSQTAVSAYAYNPIGATDQAGCRARLLRAWQGGSNNAALQIWGAYNMHRWLTSAGTGYFIETPISVLSTMLGQLDGAVFGGSAISGLNAGDTITVGSDVWEVIVNAAGTKYYSLIRQT